jgi:hypothetical protein
MKRIVKQVESAAVENLDPRSAMALFASRSNMAITSVWLPAPRGPVVLRAADKSRTREFLFVAHASTAVTVLFPQMPYLIAWGQYCRLSLLSIPCRFPLKNGLRDQAAD